MFNDSVGGPSDGRRGSSRVVWLVVRSMVVSVLVPVGVLALVLLYMVLMR